MINPYFFARHKKNFSIHYELHYFKIKDLNFAVITVQWETGLKYSCLFTLQFFVYWRI